MKSRKRATVRKLIDQMDVVVPVSDGGVVHFKLTSFPAFRESSAMGDLAVFGAREGGAMFLCSDGVGSTRRHAVALRNHVTTEWPNVVKELPQGAKVVQLPYKDSSIVVCWNLLPIEAVSAVVVVGLLEEQEACERALGQLRTRLRKAKVLR